MIQFWKDAWFRTVMGYRVIAVYPNGIKKWYGYIGDAKWHSPDGTTFVNRDK